jgi:hypothetical protein
VNCLCYPSSGSLLFKLAFKPLLIEYLLILHFSIKSITTMLVSHSTSMPAESQAPDAYNKLVLLSSVKQRLAHKFPLSGLRHIRFWLQKPLYFTAGSEVKAVVWIFHKNFGGGEQSIFCFWKNHVTTTLISYMSSYSLLAFLCWTCFRHFLFIWHFAFCRTI